MNKNALSSEGALRYLCKRKEVSGGYCSTDCIDIFQLGCSSYNEVCTILQSRKAYFKE